MQKSDYVSGISGIQKKVKENEISNPQAGD